MNIIFMGTPDFAVPSLEALKDKGYDVSLVVTQPDHARGRGKEVSFSPVKECAMRLGIPVFQPEKVRKDDALSVIREKKPDIIIVAAFGQILPKALLLLPRLGCVNIHASLLPKYRGAAPVQQCILDGEEKTGITIMQMDEGLDTGDILMQSEVMISPFETGGSLFRKLSNEGAKAVTKALPLIEKGELQPVKQDESRATYVKMIKKEQGRIDFTRTAMEIERMTRALDPWPSAFTYLNGKVLKIWRAEVSSERAAAPGTVYRVSKDDFTVSCGEGSLIIKELQLEGKKRMKTHDFLLGYEVAEGGRLE